MYHYAEYGRSISGRPLYIIRDGYFAKANFDCLNFNAWEAILPIFIFLCFFCICRSPNSQNYTGSQPQGSLILQGTIIGSNLVNAVTPSASTGVPSSRRVPFPDSDPFELPPSYEEVLRAPPDTYLVYTDAYV